jgi:hypothetical protein
MHASKDQGFKSPAIATAIARYSCLRKIKLFVSMYNLAAIARYIPFSSAIAVFEVIR